ncbi:hypothetical protein HAX54_037577 [Datura stramonium]|uniref:Uncharacterized protein n=1 Tax=Datura stramonium TaxID=4076 RepID=A0ABS8VMD5_DATST|nr:hypothetical protein [Datura stramonium]
MESRWRWSWVVSVGFGKRKGGKSGDTFGFASIQLCLAEGSRDTVRTKHEGEGRRNPTNPPANPSDFSHLAGSHISLRRAAVSRENFYDGFERLVLVPDYGGTQSHPCDHRCSPVSTDGSLESGSSLKVIF